MINDQLIRKLIKEKVSEYEIGGYYFYAFMNFLISEVIIFGLSKFKKRYCIVYFTDNKIHIFFIDKLNNIEYMPIELTSIKKITINDWKHKKGKRILIYFINGAKLNFKAYNKCEEIIEQENNLTMLSNKFGKM